MKRSTYILLALLVVMMAIVYFVKRPGEIDEATYTVTDIQMSIDPAHVVKIEIGSNKKYVRLERIQSVWKLTEPVHYIVDDEAINKLLDGLGRFKITGLVSSNPDKQRVFLVNDQGTSFIVTSDDGTQTNIIIGKSDPSSNQIYIRPESSPSVYLAQGLTSEMVNKDLREWRQRTIYKTDEKAVQVLTIMEGEDKYTLRRRGARWYFEDQSIPSQYIAPVVQACSYLRADDFVDTALIIDQPAQFHIELSGQEPFRMDVYPHAGTSSRYYVKTTASPNVFVINKSIAQSVSRLTEYLAPEPVVEATPPPVPPPSKEIVKEERPATSSKPTTGEPPAYLKWKNKPWRVTQPKPETKTPVSPPPQTTEHKTATEIKQTPPPSPPKEQPARTQTPSRVVTPPPAKTTTTSPAKLENEGELITHTVQKGETLESIAQKYSVSVDDLKRWNLLKKPNIRPGNELYIFVTKK